MPDGPKWRPNKGDQPKGSKGKRVRVKLRHSGEEPAYVNESRPDLKPGWAADTTRWALTDDPFDVVEFAIL